MVDEVVPDVLSLGEIQRVLQALLREGVSVRDLGAIVEAVGDKARLTRDPAMLAEYARQALGRTIVAPYLDAEGTLRAIALDPALEQEVAESLVQTADGEFLAMDPTARGHARAARCAEQVEHALGRGAPAGAAVLGARAPPPAPAVRAAAAAARRLLLQRDRRRASAVETIGVIGPADAMAGGDGSVMTRRSGSAGEMPMDPLTMETDVKTYRGRTLEELLPQIREELGPDAIVLRRREGLAGGVGGFFQRYFVEVEARAPAARARRRSRPATTAPPPRASAPPPSRR